MRIGVDASCWANDRGYGRFTRELMAAMVLEAPADQFVFFLDERADARFSLDAPNVVRVVVPQRVSPTEAAGAGSSRSLSDMLRFTRAIWRARLDVFFSPTVYSYFPLPPRLRAVVTIHDAIAERFPELTLPGWRARLFWNAKVALAIRQARLILTGSDFAAREVAEVLGVPRARLRVATLAPAKVYRSGREPAAIARAAENAGVPPGATWFVYVGGFNPHKHVDVLVRAHAAVASRLPAPPLLLLVGTLEGDVFHGAQGAIRRAIQEAGTEALIRWTGFVKDEELCDLLAGAVAVVLPSASEGFGLPAVEGAACGIPVIATTASPLPELLPGGGVFVPPDDAGALADAMVLLATDRETRGAMAAAAERGAQRLTWPAGARAALAALREAAA
jgi:glycosyltransferase involved in cell wall biosynthesis